MDDEHPGRAVPGSEFSHQLRSAAATIDRLRSSLHLGLRSEYWFGERADLIRATWESIVSPALADSARLLQSLSRDAVDDPQHEETENGDRTP